MTYNFFEKILALWSSLNLLSELPFLYSSTLILIFIIIAITILLVIFYDSTLPNYFILDYKVVVKILDTSGRKAKIFKEIKRICNHKGISEIIYRNNTADGRLANFRSNLDPNPEVTKEADEYIVRVRLKRALRKFEKINDILEWEILDSFLKNTEHWKLVADYRIFKIRIEIILPEGRNCIGEPRLFLCKGAEAVQIPGVKLDPAGKRIFWEKSSIFGLKSGTKYIIEWDWTINN